MTKLLQTYVNTPEGIKKFPWIEYLLAPPHPLTCITVRPVLEVIEHSVTRVHGMNYGVEVAAIRGGAIRRHADGGDTINAMDSAGISHGQGEFTAQVMIEDDDTACAFIHRHRLTDHDSLGDHDTIVIYQCDKGKTFGDYSEIAAWISAVSHKE